MFDLKITDSHKVLENYLENVTEPIVFWGHTETGKSEMVSQAIKHLNGTKINISVYECLIENDKAYLPISFAKPPDKEKGPSFIIWEFANKNIKEQIYNASILFNSIIGSELFKKNRKLLLFAHPHTEELNEDLLGLELKQISDELYNGKLPKYDAYQLPQNIMEQSNHIAVFPSVERWLKYMNEKGEGVVVNFISDLFENDFMEAYRALYSFFFGTGFLSNVRNLSPRHWENLDTNIKMLEDKIVFTGSFKDFDRDSVKGFEDWILKNAKFPLEDGTSLSGIDNILPLINTNEDFQILNEHEINHMLKILEIFLVNMEDFKEQFEDYFKNYYKAK